MAQITGNRSRLMQLSWDIQRNSNRTRSEALTAAWAFFSNEKILVSYLLRALNRGSEPEARVRKQYSLFRV